MVALVERLNQVEPRGHKRGCDLRMRNAWPAHDVDGPSEKVIAVRYTANRAIMFDRSEGARNDAEWSRDPGDSGGDGLSGLRVSLLSGGMSDARRRRDEQRPKTISVRIPQISLPQQESA